MDPSETLPTTLTRTLSRHYLFELHDIIRIYEAETTDSSSMDISPNNSRLSGLESIPAATSELDIKSDERSANATATQTTHPALLKPTYRPGEVPADLRYLVKWFSQATSDFVTYCRKRPLRGDGLETTHTDLLASALRAAKNVSLWVFRNLDTPKESKAQADDLKSRALQIIRRWKEVVVPRAKDSLSLASSSSLVSSSERQLLVEEYIQSFEVLAAVVNMQVGWLLQSKPTTDSAIQMIANPGNQKRSLTSPADPNPEPSADRTDRPPPQSQMSTQTSTAAPSNTSVTKTVRSTRAVAPSDTGSKSTAVVNARPPPSETGSKSTHTRPRATSNVSNTTLVPPPTHIVTNNTGSVRTLARSMSAESTLVPLDSSVAVTNIHWNIQDLYSNLANLKVLYEQELQTSRDRYEIAMENVRRLSRDDSYIRMPERRLSTLARIVTQQQQDPQDTIVAAVSGSARPALRSQDELTARSVLVSPLVVEAQKSRRRTTVIGFRGGAFPLGITPVDPKPIWSPSENGAADVGSVLPSILEKPGKAEDVSDDKEMLVPESIDQQCLAVDVDPKMDRQVRGRSRSFLSTMFQRRKSQQDISSFEVKEGSLVVERSALTIDAAEELPSQQQELSTRQQAGSVAEPTGTEPPAPNVPRRKSVIMGIKAAVKTMISQ